MGESLWWKESKRILIYPGKVQILLLKIDERACLHWVYKMSNYLYLNQKSFFLFGVVGKSFGDNILIYCMQFFFPAVLLMNSL